MSIESWKLEFYKIPADEFLKREGEPQRTAQEAVEHSLLKWKGLLHKNLEKHDLTVIPTGAIEDSEFNTFHIDTTSCSLCCKYEGRCSICPFKTHLGHFCTRPSKFGVNSSWGDRRANNRAQPMINDLEEILRIETSRERGGRMSEEINIFKSYFLLEKAIRTMKRKGYAIKTRSEYCGVIEVTWRKINETV